jgi:hypothetical protein
MQVPAALYYASAAVQLTRPLWRMLSGIESAVLREEIDRQSITAPVYIAGVARSGSTILLEMLEQHPDLTSHRYSDFPHIYTPYWHNWLKQRTHTGGRRVKERAHRDRIQITEQSPEAIEEVLWTAFFPDCHAGRSSEVLTGEAVNPSFDAFYAEHIRKLLLIRNSRRYLSKGNYNLTRLGYIQRLFPDARFVIPVRHPVSHIASLMKQDHLFNAGLQGSPRARRYLSWAAHFEFGPDKRPVHTGDEALFQTIVNSWEKGDGLLGWALYWNTLYRFFLDQLESSPLLQEACLLVRYEDLCRDSSASIDQLLAHCRLEHRGFVETREYYIEHLSEPSYYRPEFSPEELKVIDQTCGATASRLGYTTLSDPFRPLSQAHGRR